MGRKNAVYDSYWEHNYKLAEEYYKENNNLLVPQKYITKSGDKLGKWINTQRTFYRTGKLSEEKINRLEKIGMYWKTPSSWDVYYELAKNYYEHYGNLRIPPRYQTKDGVTEDKEGVFLGKWINTQKIKFLSGDLSVERIEKLNKIEMIWYIRNKTFYKKTITEKNITNIKIELLRKLQEIIKEDSKTIDIKEVEEKFKQKIK